MDAKTIATIAAKSGMIIIITLASVFGNCLVLAVVYRNPRLRKLTNAYVVSLALSDVSMALFCMPLTITSMITVDWSLGDIACRMQALLGVSLSFISLQTMTLTAVNRYFRIVQPRKYPSIFTKRSTIAMLVVTWIFGLCFGELYRWASGGEIVYIVKAGTCFPRGIPLAVIIVGYLLPSVLMMVCYCLVFRVVRRHALTVTCSLQRGDQPLGPSCEELNATKILFVVMLGFILCWVPTQIIGIILGKVLKTLPPEFPTVCFGLIYFSCAINPIIYGVMNHAFRKEFKKMFRSVKNMVVNSCSSFARRHFKIRPSNQQDELVLKVF